MSEKCAQCGHDIDGITVDCPNCGHRVREGRLAGRLAIADSAIEGWRSLAASLRDERDVLALNFGQKETGVLVVKDNEGEVIGVAWPKPGPGAGSDNVTRFPRRFLEQEAAGPTHD
jgi:hypothetical protein